MSWEDSLSSLLTNPAVATLLPTVLGGVGGALSSPIIEGRRGAIGGAIRGAGAGLGEGIQNMQRLPLLQQQLQKEKILTQQAQMTLSNDQTKQQFAQSLPPDKQALFMSDPKGYMDTYVLAPHKAQTDMAALQEQSKSDPQLAAQLPSIAKLDPSAQSKFADKYWEGKAPKQQEPKVISDVKGQYTLDSSGKATPIPGVGPTVSATLGEERLADSVTKQSEAMQHQADVMERNQEKSDKALAESERKTDIAAAKGIIADAMSPAKAELKGYTPKDIGNDSIEWSPNGLTAGLYSKKVTTTTGYDNAKKMVAGAVSGAGKLPDLSGADLSAAKAKGYTYEGVSDPSKGYLFTKDGKPVWVPAKTSGGD